MWHRPIARASVISREEISLSIFRIFSEQFRLPDEQIGYIFNMISMGTLLSLIMLITGVFLLKYAKNN